MASELLDVFAHGISFVKLAPIGNAELVIPMIAQMLGVAVLVLSHTTTH